MDNQTLLAQLEFTRARLLGSLTTIEKSGQDTSKVLAWRPGPGRAHIAWQAMHCAATHDKYLHVRILGGTEHDKQLVERFGGGSTPSDQDVPSLVDIRATLDRHYAPVRDYIASLKPADLDRVIEFPNNTQRSLGEALILLIWHEAHHQGQIHLTWNLYKASHGL